MRTFMVGLLALLILSPSFAKGPFLFNKTKIESIEFKRRVDIIPGTKRTLLSSDHWTSCYLHHAELTAMQSIGVFRKFPVTSNRADTTNYSINGNFGVALIRFSGLHFARLISCEISNIWDEDLKISDIQYQLRGVVEIKLP